MQTEIKILLVEDNEGDIVLTLEALSQAKVKDTVDVVKDGEAALKYLHRQDQYAGAATPDLILLDINLPKIDGKEVLAGIKNDPLLKFIPVIMLTTSDAEKDILESYRKHANCYITKPVDFIKFMDVVLQIKDFWISTVKLPTTVKS